jgi:urea transport system permease protein
MWGRRAFKQAAAVLLFAATIAPAVASAAGFSAELETALRDLGSTDSDQVKRALTTIGDRNEAGALPALDAFYDDRLRVGPDGAVYIQDSKKNLLINPLTGAAVSPLPQPLRTVEMDNETRRLAAPVMARLRLFAPDPAIRLTAAEELASADESLMPMLRGALDKETDTRVKDALSLALARHDLQSPDAGKRLAALETLRKLAKLATKSEIESLFKNDPDKRVRDAASSALSAIRGKELLINGVGSVVYGLSLASVFLFAALGLAITFGVMGVINMAHGEMLTIGAYTTYAVQVLFQRHFPSLLPFYLFAAIPLAFVVATAAGMLLERGVIRHLYGRPLETLLATWGISLCLIQTIRLIFGASNVAVANPSWLAGGAEIVSGITVPYSRIGVVVFVIAAAVFVWFVLQKTRLGLQVRAVVQNRPMAACMGVSTKRIDMWTFGLGSGIAGLGGVALSQLGNVGPELGQGYILDSFMVVVLGGVGRIAGTIGAALGLGIVQKFLEPVSGAVLGKIAVLVVIILFIQRRPQGMFPVKGRVEA